MSSSYAVPIFLIKGDNLGISSIDLKKKYALLCS